MCMISNLFTESRLTNLFYDNLILNIYSYSFLGDNFKCELPRFDINFSATLRYI